MIMNLKKGEPFYRVSFITSLPWLGVEHRMTMDWMTLERALEYVKEQRNRNGKDFTIEKVVTTYEVIYEAP